MSLSQIMLEVVILVVEAAVILGIFSHMENRTCTRMSDRMA